MHLAKKGFLWVFVLAGGMLAGVAAVGLSQHQSTVGLPPAPLRSPNDLSQAFRQVSEHALPAVVMIRAEVAPREVEVQGNQPRFSDPQRRFLEQFFGEQDLDQLFGEGQRRFMPGQQGTGSGFIVDSTGIVLTNSHVVEGADKVTVILNDGRELQAESWKYDPRTDLAIVRLAVDGPLPSLVLGDSDQMQVGDWVLALGNPFDVGTSVTAGIVSAKGRGPGINERESYLQTDAAINPGNSGGPLVNLNGEVIGINTAISSRSGGYDGIGFAIPSNMVRWVADQLIQKGKVERSYLGVKLQPLTLELRKQLGVPAAVGALVNQVFPDSPAGKAGIQEGDVIIEFAGKKIADQSALVEIVEQLPPHKAYPAQILRDGQEQTLQVTLAPMPDDYTPALQRLQSRSAERPNNSAEVGVLGLELTPLTDELRQQLNVDETVSGLVVVRVRPNTPAARAGLQPRDIIQRVGSNRVSTLEEFGAAVKGFNPDQGVLMHVRRGATSTFVVVK
jgi:serine protease Do